MFRPNWPSSGVQVVIVKDSDAHCNAGFFPPIVVAFGYFGYVCYHQFYLDVLGLYVVVLVLFGLLVVAALKTHEMAAPLNVKSKECVWQYGFKNNVSFHNLFFS
jgi:hypothetical protein